MSEKKGKILFIPMCSQGHVNYVLTVAKGFLAAYGDKHEVHFAVDQEYSDKIHKWIPHPALKTHVYQSPMEKEKKDDGNKHWLVEFMQQYGDTWSTDCVKYVHECAPIFNMMFESAIMGTYDDLTKIVKEVQPSIVIYDQLFATPVGQDQGIPWANFFSCALNFVGLKGMPPPQSGLPTEWSPENEKLWEDFIDRAYRTGPWKTLRDKCSEFLKSKGVEGIPEENYMCYKASPYLNLYGYVKELDWAEDPKFKFPRGTWLRLETPVTKPFPEPYPIPEKLKNKPGKLIYFSLGSMATVYRPLMTKVLRILAKIPHRFIVSKGMIGHEYDGIMADNMYGENYVNQFAVLRTVQIIISHGGNNTLTESMNFGVPLIIMPLFGDQSDNAQRVHERGLGRRVSIFDDEEKLKRDLEEAIEFCSSEPVVQKMQKISQRIQADSGLSRICDELAKYCEGKVPSN